MSAAAAAAPAESAAAPALKQVTLEHDKFRDQPTITLVSSDGMEFPVPKNVAEQSVTIQDLLSMSPETKITLDNVEGSILKLIVDWAIYHTVWPIPPTPEAEKTRTDNMSDWDKAFVAPHQENHEIVFAMLRAANWLNMDTLLKMYSKVVANSIKLCTPEGVRSKFAMPPGAPSRKFLPNAGKTNLPAASAAQ